MAIDVETNFANSERCMKESFLEEGNNVEGTMVTNFHAREEKCQIINHGCSKHITSDKSKFFKLEKYEGGLVKFGDDTSAKICGKCSINFYGNHNRNDVPYVKGLRHNVLSVRKMCSKGYNIMFQDDGFEIRKGYGTLVVARKMIK